jgi:acetylornithine deacetylase/succinyl-diaminopimelate desuccinylase-like protein
MKLRLLASALALTVTHVGGAAAVPPDDRALVKTAKALRTAALQDDTAYKLTETIVTEFGPRAMGSESQHRASRWAADELKAMGFDRVSIESFPVSGWFHGADSAAVTSPFPQPLVVASLGGSAPTPEGGLEAEIAVFKTYEDMLAAPQGALSGKIAVVTQAMPRFDSGDGYFDMGRIRSSGAIEAAKRGAVSFLMRSLSTAMTRSPHTGGMRYSDDVPKIPAAALAPPDAAALERMVEHNQPVRVRLAIAPTQAESPVQAQNVVADIVGSDRPDEIVLIGAHIDSWGTTPGALDNASGVAIVMSAARLIKEKVGNPRRTIRIVIFGAEEFGGASGRAYADAHGEERDSYVMASESDSGAAYVQEIKLPGKAASHAFGKTFASLIEPLGTRLSLEPSSYGGVDVNRLSGVPLVSVRADLTDYFDVHHGDDDTLDKVDPEDIRRSVATWATLVYLASESDVDFRALTSSAE